MKLPGTYDVKMIILSRKIWPGENGFSNPVAYCDSSSRQHVYMLCLCPPGGRANRPHTVNTPSKHTLLDTTWMSAKYRNLNKLTTDRGLSLLSESTPAFCDSLWQLHLPRPQLEGLFWRWWRRCYRTAITTEQNVSIYYTTALLRINTSICIFKLSREMAGEVNILCCNRHIIHLPWERDAILSAQNKALWYCCCKHTDRQTGQRSLMCGFFLFCVAWYLWELTGIYVALS